MIVKTKRLTITTLHTKNPFEDIKCVIKNNEIFFSSKSVLFCRYVGMDNDEYAYINKLRQLDINLKSMNANYIRLINGLKNDFDINEINETKNIMKNYMDLESKGDITSSELYNINLGYKIENECLEWTKKLVFKEILDLYDENNNSNITIRKNFGIKLLLWMNKYLKEMFQNKCDLNLNPKVVFYGEIKKHELYFLIMLSKLGCDILYINPNQDLDYKVLIRKEYTNVIKCKHIHNAKIQFPEVNNTIMENKVKSIEKNFNEKSDLKVQNKKSYEELAKMAESVVLINIYDSDKNLTGRGSGVVISEDGFIITNFHVVREDVQFGVIFENDKTEYMVYQVTKYNQDYDLALIRVEKKSNYIKLDKKNLVRGEKIVVIGSPLGLFNTISDGIISGFRDFDRLTMLQITAPISPGSSGGALLNMYGNLVGIIMGGYEGQNLNLAIPAIYIDQFAGNIMK